jgi:hypothetical protein
MRGNAPRESARWVEVGRLGWFFLSSWVKKGRPPVQKLRKISPMVCKASVDAFPIPDQGLGGRDGPSKRTVPTITTQPTASSQSPWRIMALRGMHPVP